MEKRILKYLPVNVLCVLIFFLIANTVVAQVGIEQLDPDTLSVLDLGSTDKGLLIPKMTSAQRIALGNKASSEQNALLVYDTDIDAFFYLVNNQWHTLNGWNVQVENNTTKNMFLDTRIAEKVGIKEDPASNEKLAVNGHVVVHGDVETTGIDVDGDVETTGSISSTGGVRISTSGNGFSTPEYSSVGIAGKSGPVPPGSIIPFYGLVDLTGESGDFNANGIGKTGSEKEGWAVCNGYNGLTPDLTGRFIVGAGTSYSLNATGGENTHVLTVDELPSHNHVVDEESHRHGFDPLPTAYDEDGPNSDVGADGDCGAVTYTDYATVTVDCSPTGGDQPHENRPPYFVLYYIMKLY